MKKTLLFLGMLLLIFTLTACKSGNGDDRPVVYVTVYPMEFLVREIAGDTVNIKRVPGSTSHSDSVDWSAKEIIDMANADLLFYLHAGVDDYIPNNADNVFSDGDVELVDMSSYIEYNLVCYSHSHDEEEDHILDEHTCEDSALTEDPHFWLDPVRMLQAATLVRDKLLLAYPDNSELFNNNFTVLSSSLEKLDEDFQEMADEATKPIITTVMLFTYWHERYDIEILPITYDAHSTEANPGDIINLINTALEENIMFVLYELNANSPAGDQVLGDLQVYNNLASALYLHGIGNLTTTEIDNGANYLTIMYDNLEVLRSATK